MMTRKAAGEIIKDEWVQDAFQLWLNWKLLGDPFNSGWANWPAHILDIIDTIETEVKKIDNRRASGKANT